MQVSTIGVGLAKNVFQAHGVDSAGKVVITRQLRRLARFLLAWSAWKPAEPLIIGRVKFPSSATPCVPPSYVKGYVKRSKNGAAAAICEAVTRPSMRFVPIKAADQQAVLMLHRTRDLLLRQRTQLINAL